MSLLQRRHYVHLAIMAGKLDTALKNAGANDWQRSEARSIIYEYMAKANSNFNPTTFAKAAGWTLEEA